MWKNLSRKTRIVIIVASVSVAALMLLSVFSPRESSSTTPTSPSDVSSPYIPGAPSESPTGEMPSTPSEQTPNEGKVDVDAIDIQNMSLDYEALALMSTYYFISDGDIGDDARKEIMGVSSADVVAMFDEHWDSKRALAREYPQLKVFVDATKVSDAPAGENDVAISILADVFRSVDGGAIEPMGKVRWTVFFDITSASNIPGSGAEWTIDRFTIRIID